MTMPQPSRPQKPPRRFWLFAPYVALVAGAVLWSLAWLAISGHIAGRMDAAATQLRARGYQVDWKARRIDGYPFRIDITLDAPRLIEPSGWGLTAAKLKGQAFAYNLDNWIVVAPQGLDIHRPAGGVVGVSGLLRASFAGFARNPPRIAVEGVNLTFTPAPGAAFPLSRAAHLGLFLRPLDADRAQALIRFDGGASAPGRVLERVAAGRPTAAIVDLVVDKLGAFRGADWPSAVRAWSAAGGGLEVAHGGLAGGGAWLGVRPGRLTVRADGQVSGGVGLLAHGAPAALRALGEGGPLDPRAADAAALVAEVRAGSGPTARVDLTFQAGATTLGPIAIGAAPRVF